MPYIFVAFMGVVLFSCQKGGEPVPYGSTSGDGVYEDVSAKNQRGGQTDPTGGESGSNGVTGTKGGEGDTGGGSATGGGTVIGGDDNEDDDDVVEILDLGGEEPKTGESGPIGGGGI